MPIPREHKKSLERESKIHRDRLTTLRSQIEYMQREIRIHELVLALADNEAVLQTLDAMVDDPEEAARACEDPRGYAASRGIDIPEQLAVSVYRGEQDVEVRVKYKDDLYPFELQWDRAKGFTVHRPDPATDAAAT